MADMWPHVDADTLRHRLANWGACAQKELISWHWSPSVSKFTPALPSFNTAHLLLLMHSLHRPSLNQYHEARIWYVKVGMLRMEDRLFFSSEISICNWETPNSIRESGRWEKNTEAFSGLGSPNCNRFTVSQVQALPSPSAQTKGRKISNDPTPVPLTVGLLWFRLIKSHSPSS